MRANRLLAVTVLSVLGVTGLTACDSGGDGKNGAAPAAPASAPSSPVSSAPPTAVSSPPTAAGGGLEKLTVPEITAKSRAAGKKLTSAKFTAEVQNNGKKMGAVVAADSAGNCVGTMSVEGKGSAEIRRAAGKVWLKPDAEFIRMLLPGRDDAATAVLRDKWLTTSKSGEAASFTAFCDMALQYQQKIGTNDDGSLDDQGRVTGTERVDGVEAVVISLEDEDGTPMEAAIADTGEPHLLSMDSEGRGHMRYGDFDKPVKVTAPPADQVIDFGALQAD